jgi:hypothetical protein
MWWLLKEPQKTNLECQALQYSISKTFTFLSLQQSKYSILLSSDNAYFSLCFYEQRKKETKKKLIMSHLSFLLRTTLLIGNRWS